MNIGQRFGVLDMDEAGAIHAFREKNDDDGSLINGGYMVMNPSVFDYIEGDDTVFEQAPLRNLASDGELMAYRHEGFWKCMEYPEREAALEECGRIWKGSLEDLGIGDHMDLREVFEFYKGKKVLVTGHTGFKGAWLCPDPHKRPGQRSPAIPWSRPQLRTCFPWPAWREGWIQSLEISGIWTI